MYQAEIEASAEVGGGWLAALAMVPVGIGVLALIGWSTGIEVLTSVRHGLTAMNPMTALGLIVAGIATILRSQGRQRFAQPLSAALVMLGASKILEVTLGWPAIDNLLFSGGISPQVFGPGRIAPNTAVCFMLLGVAGLLLGYGDRFCVASQLLAACVALIALFAMVGYMLGVAPLYTVAALRPMALHAAAGMFVSAICLAGVQRCGIVAILLDRGPAGGMARTVLPTAVLIPIAIGGARLWGERAGLFGTEVGISIMVVANVTLTCSLLASAIFTINRGYKARLEREAALRRSQEFAQVGHVQWSEPDPRPIWSEEAIRIHGIAAGSPAPSLTQWPELIHAEDRTGFRDYLATARLTGLDREWRGRIVRPDGKVRQVRVHLAADRSLGESSPALFGIVSDVTDLEQARRQAEGAARAKSAFLANMSHEIRTPLNGVLGFSESLMRAPLDTEDHEHAKLVHQSAEALLNLLNDILDFSKIEAGSMDLAPEPTRLPELLRECVALVEPAARAKRIAIFLHLHEDVPAWAMIDGLKLRQIALNLLGNAVKFTDHGFVALEVCGSEPCGGQASLMIRVHDTGVGVPIDRQQAIFGDFVQADPTVGRRFGGTGLGLSISRRLAELLGGTLTLESELGRGTKVELNLPIVAIVDVEAQDKPPPPMIGVRGARVLLVEDVELNQRLATTILTKLGHSVELAVDGVEAVRKMRDFERGQSAFDLLFMDIQLPELDGLSATRQIRKLGPRSKAIPIIALSANAYASDVAVCRDAGMDDHLPKPFSIDSLSRAIGRWYRPDREPAPPGLDPQVVASLVPMFLDQCIAAATIVGELDRSMALGSDREHTELASRVAHAAHKLAGTAASFGELALGNAARRAEQYLAALTKTADFPSARAGVAHLSLELAATLAAHTTVAA